MPLFKLSIRRLCEVVKDVEIGDDFKFFRHAAKRSGTDELAAVTQFQLARSTVRLCATVCQNKRVELLNNLSLIQTSIAGRPTYHGTQRYNLVILGGTRQNGQD